MVDRCLLGVFSAGDIVSLTVINDSDRQARCCGSSGMQPFLTHLKIQVGAVPSGNGGQVWNAANRVTRLLHAPVTRVRPEWANKV